MKLPVTNQRRIGMVYKTSSIFTVLFSTVQIRFKSKKSLFFLAFFLNNRLTVIII